MVIPFCKAQSSNSFEVNSGPLSVLMAVGLPLFSMMRSKVLVTRLADREVSTSIAGASLLQSSHDDEGSELSAIYHTVAHKIHAPGLIHC